MKTRTLHTLSRHLMALVLVATVLFSFTACGETATDDVTSACHNCNEELSVGSLFCPHCGAAVNVVCQSCNEVISADSKFCSHCGAEVAAEADSEINVEQNTAEDEDTASTPEPTPEPTSEAIATPEVSPSAEPTPTPSPTLTPAPTAIPTPTPTPTSIPIPTPTPTPKPTNNPVVTSSKSEIHLETENYVTYITVSGMHGEYSIWYEIDDTNIVKCEWGEWSEDGDTCALTVIPIADGDTSVKLYVEGYESKATTISVSVNIPSAADYSGLLINDIGEAYTSANSIYWNKTEINSADYEITDHNYDDKIDIKIEVALTVLEHAKNADFISFSYIDISYELLNDAGVCVKTGNIWQEVNREGQKFVKDIYFSSLDAGYYTLNFIQKDLPDKVYSSPAGNSSDDGYGRVHGQLTYQYNKVIGTRGDNGAKVMLIPINDEVKNYDNGLAALLITGTYDSGIIVTKCDGYGNFDFGNVVPTGRYIFIGVSENTTAGARFNDEAAWKERINNIIGGLLSATDMESLYTAIGYSSWCWDTVTIGEGDSLNITNDFGYTFI